MTGAADIAARETRNQRWQCAALLASGILLCLFSHSERSLLPAAQAATAFAAQAAPGAGGGARGSAVTNGRAAPRRGGTRLIPAPGAATDLPVTDYRAPGSAADPVSLALATPVDAGGALPLADMLARAAQVAPAGGDGSYAAGGAGSGGGGDGSGLLPGGMAAAPSGSGGATSPGTTAPPVSDTTPAAPSPAATPTPTPDPAPLPGPDGTTPAPGDNPVATPTSVPGATPTPAPDQGVTPPVIELPPQPVTPVPPIGQPVLPSVPSGVPEPATWMMLIFGFGAIGALLRRRSTTRGSGGLAAELQPVAFEGEAPEPGQRVLA